GLLLAKEVESMVILKGNRWVTLMKFPVALSGGIRANLAPVAPLKDCTLPFNVKLGKASTLILTACPISMSFSLVSLKLAVTQRLSASTTAQSDCPAITYCPGSTDRLVTMPLQGAMT